MKTSIIYEGKKTEMNMISIPMKMDTNGKDAIRSGPGTLNSLRVPLLDTD